jgi:hypothetical protein
MDDKVVEITEFHHTGPNEYDGKFFGITAGGEEVAINICGAGAAEFHKRTMDRVNDRKPYYKFRKNLSYMLNNVRCVQSVNVSPTEVVKEGKSREVVDFFGQRITRKEWKTHDCVCQLCKEVVTWRDAEEVVWIDPDELVCKNCKDDELVEEYLSTFVKTEKENVIG